MNNPSRNGTPRIMVVDDEQVVTQTIKSFLQLETDFDVHTFQSPVEALSRMDDLRADVVLSDFLMPEMNGLEFLAEVRRKEPDAVRVLLTGYADKESAIRAINEVEIYQYLEKPWDNDQLVLTIKNGLRQKRLDAQLSNKIRELDRTLLEKDRIREENEAFREELSMARRVQEAMLPDLDQSRSVSFHASYQPALAVGGDFYDVIGLRDGRIAAIVADATGHGIQAALSTTLLKAAFTEVASTASGPQGILLGMNDIVHRVLPTDLFIAATVAVVGNNTIRVAGAGGPHPVLMRRAGELERLVCNGLPLGVVESGVYPGADEVERDLGDGDVLLIFSDGITEVENSDGEEFGDIGLRPALRDFLAAGLSSADILAALVDSARQFARDGHQWDDVTLLALTRPS